MMDELMTTSTPDLEHDVSPETAFARLVEVMLDEWPDPADMPARVRVPFAAVIKELAKCFDDADDPE
jgi:hypothetical protein